MQNSDMIRLSFFLAVLFLCFVWEWCAPRKKLTQNKVTRWVNNLGLVGLNSFILALLMPLMAIEAALWAQSAHIGLFNWMTAPLWLSVLIGILILDCAIYTQHVVFHRVPWLWCLHRMHHADQDIDVTTGARFHPIEILLSMWIKIAIVISFGLSPITVLVFEIILNASAMFNHSNAKLPLKIDKWMRKIVVTPDMHRVHHSVIVKETHSNFGFFLSIWDRLFSTYRAQPQLGHHDVEIGLPLFRQSREQWLDKMLSQPFRKQ